MKRMKIMAAAALVCAAMPLGAGAQAKGAQTKGGEEKVALAYVTSWTSVMPDPARLTHINYAFGHVTESFDGVRIANEERLREMVKLREVKPTLKVLLSIGGWGSGRFSEMAADDRLRASFARDCARVVKEFALDGIDIDWEYPTSDMAKISASPADTDNYTLMMRDIRREIGPGKLLTLATAANAKYIDFRAIDPYIDFVNIMSYDMGNPPYHHSGLYRSEHTGDISVDEAVGAHIAAGVVPSKLVMGIPFYGRGTKAIGNFSNYKHLVGLAGFERRWDEAAQGPYLVDGAGEFACGYDDARSIAIKCDYILNKGLRGAMYWDYDGDDEAGTLRTAVYNGLNN